MASLSVASANPVGYVHSKFGSGWIYQTGDGCDTRADVLKAQTDVPVTFTTAGGCTVATGEWHSWYDDKVWTDASDVQIDHLVPLGEAWASGASSWNSAQRSAYANDIGIGYALQAVTSSVNESKSDDDPAHWMPPAAAAACQYVTDWMLVKYRWSLTIDTAENSKLNEVLGTGGCGDTIVALPEVKIAPPTAAGVPIRYTGDDRYDVAVQISQQFKPDVPVVYVAKGTDYPDSLSAAPAAASEGGPMLLVTPTSIPPSVAAELSRLKPLKIVVVGGEGSVSAGVFDELTTYVTAPENVVRIGGADRYEASRNVNAYAFGTTGVSRVYLATGTNFPDALSASADAGSHDAAVLLVYGTSNSLDQATRDEITLLHPDNVVIAGGPGSVSSGIETAVTALNLPGGSQRLSGEDRFEASEAINHETYTTANTVYLATGFNFPDALAGAALAGRDTGPLYVVRTDCIPQSILADIRAFGSPQVVLFGGPASVTQAVADLQPCLAPPTGSLSFTCSPSPTLTASITNPNLFAVAVTIQLGAAPGTTVNVPAHTTASFAGPTPAEDTTSYVYLRYNGAYIYSTVVHRDCSAPAPPSNPGDTKNCSDFPNHAAAQAWFDYYYPYYGDIARLDQDNDLIACESL
ncbi:MAG: cell wall-binding repeat-containing protein [Pseudolysinimonas sp.]